MLIRTRSYFYFPLTNIQMFLASVFMWMLSPGISNMLFRFSLQNIGGGWIEAQNSRGDVGLVPEDYIEVREMVPECMVVVPSHILLSVHNKDGRKPQNQHALRSSCTVSDQTLECILSVVSTSVTIYGDTFLQRLQTS